MGLASCGQKWKEQRVLLVGLDRVETRVGRHGVNLNVEGTSLGWNVGPVVALLPCHHMQASMMLSITASFNLLPPSKPYL